jgi:arylformamidase
VLIDFTDKRKGDPITLEDLEGRAQCIQEGDIVFLYTGLSRNYRTRRSHDRPYLPPDAVLWLVERGIACLGVDCSGIEERGLPEQPSHRTLLEHGIPLIEHLTHLDRLTEERFFVVAVPWRVRGLDASPVSVVAFESE